MQRHEVLMRFGREDNEIMKNGYNNKAQPHCISHPLEVDKRRIAYHTSISVEHTETNHIKQLIKQQCVDNGHDVGSSARQAEEQHAHKNATKNANEAVDKEDAPVRQRLSTEIPVN